MPYVQITTSKRVDDAQKHSLCEELGKLMPLIPGKTRENTMFAVLDGCYMEKADASAPCLNAEIRVFGPIVEDAKRAFTQKISALFESALGVSPARMYINYVEFDNWGSNGEFKMLK